MRPVLFHIGTFGVPSFWVMAFLGFLAAFLVVRHELARRGYDPGLIYDMTLHAYVGGWVGARLLLIPTAWSYFAQDPLGFLLSSSGWAWYGGLLGGALAVWLWARRERIPTLVAGDMVAPGLAIGQAIGRIGCQLAGDGDYGLPTALPWGMSYPRGVVPTAVPVHPTPLYELAGGLLIFAYLWRRRRRPGLPEGDLFGRYLVLAGILRFLVEFVRRNPRLLAGLTEPQLLSLLSVGLGGYLLRRAAGRRPAPRFA